MNEMVYYISLYASVSMVLSLLFWFLYFQNRSEKVLLFIALEMSFLLLQLICTVIYSTTEDIFTNGFFHTFSDIFWGLETAAHILILTLVFRKKRTLFFSSVIVALSFFPITGDFLHLTTYYWLSFQLLLLIVSTYLIISSWKSLNGAQWAVVPGIVITFVFSAFFQYQSLMHYGAWPFPYCFVLLGGVFLSFPLSLMIYVAMRFKEILKDVERNALEVVQLLEEKKEQAIKQQQILEEEVARQTIELRTSFENLKSTQSQLIQSEKMASLGELTAGIAHEIQNPLNFVNNFSEVSNELVDEMNDELDKGDIAEAKTIATDIKQNLEKINHHGKRADAIVKGMLQHSQASTGKKEPTNINALADEYLRLAYHGLRAKDKEFNADFKTEFDESIGKINIVPQDIGRVLLNLYNNAFYAVNERQKAESSKLNAENRHVPTVTVVTKKLNANIEIRVADNGNGIPQKVVDKIFQPFFTTKPTGQGTGLGLSLSYDIIKAHGGEIKVETKEGEGSEFIIILSL